MNTDTIRKIDTGRVILNVRERGEGSPLVLLHGWPESGYCWESVLPFLDPSLRVVRPDLRGLGTANARGRWATTQRRNWPGTCWP